MLQAEDLIIAALNRGDLTASEARELQDVVAQAWQARKEAERAPPDLLHSTSPEEGKRLISEAATRLGMVWPRS
jgi:polyhydroxyalkanoate synthesis regulator phasin